MVTWSNVSVAAIPPETTKMCPMHTVPMTDHNWSTTRRRAIFSAVGWSFSDEQNRIVRCSTDMANLVVFCWNLHSPSLRSFSKSKSSHVLHFLSCTETELINPQKPTLGREEEESSWGAPVGVKAVPDRDIFYKAKEVSDSPGQRWSEKIQTQDMLRKPMVTWQDIITSSYSSPICAAIIIKGFQY